MGVSALQLYQGDEWSTRRPTVAQAFDTLDRLRVLCVESLPESAVESAAPLSLARTVSSDMRHPIMAEPAQESLVMVLAAMAGLADDLAGELDAVTAELSPLMQADVSRRWMAFEMQTHMNAMRELLQEEREADTPSIIVLDDVLIYAERIDSLLKHIDQ